MRPKHTAFSMFLGSEDKENFIGPTPLLDNGKVDLGKNSSLASKAFKALPASERKVWEDLAAEKNAKEEEKIMLEVASVGETEFVRRR